MEKLYNRTNWVDNNEPDIDAAHLNNIESGIDAIDNRVIDLNDGLNDFKNSGYLPKNLVGSDTNTYYPIDNSISGFLTISTKSGVQPTSDRQLYFYNEDKTKSDYYTFGTAYIMGSRTVPIDTTSMKFEPKFAKWRTYDNNDDLMVEYGQTKSSYVDYFPPVAQVNNTLSDLEFLGWEVPSEFSVKNSISGNVFTQRVGRIDLGTLEYSRDSEGRFVYYDSVTRYFKITGSRVDDAFLREYECKHNGESYNSNWNKVFYFASNALFIHDKSCTDATAFKNAMKGKYLYYELATPITYNVGSEAVERVNESLDEQGLLNKFVNDMKQGEISNTDGSYHASSNSSYTDGYIPAKTNDKLTIEVSKAQYINVLFYNGTTFTSALSSGVLTNEYTFTVPDGVNSFRVCFYNPSGVSPSSVGEVEIYVNNNIKAIKQDLRGFVVEKVTLTVSDASLCVIPAKTGYMPISVMPIMKSDSLNPFVTGVGHTNSGYYCYIKGWASNNIAINTQIECAVTYVKIF